MPLDMSAIFRAPSIFPNSSLMNMTCSERFLCVFSWTGMNAKPLQQNERSSSRDGISLCSFLYGDFLDLALLGFAGGIRL